MSLSKKDLFLVEASKLGHGDCVKKIDITGVCREIHFDDKNEELRYGIIPSLISDGYIADFINDKYITITRKGYYYAIKISGLPASNFEMVLYHEARKLSVELLKYLCNLTYERHETYSISIVKIENYAEGYGGEAHNQAINILREGDLIHIDDHGTVKVTDKGRLEVIKNLLINIKSV